MLSEVQPMPEPSLCVSVALQLGGCRGLLPVLLAHAAGGSGGPAGQASPGLLGTAGPAAVQQHCLED